MVKALRDLQAYCELIMFTYIPKGLCDSFLNKVPELRNIFSYILTGGDLLLSDEGLLIKDVSHLL